MGADHTEALRRQRGGRLLLAARPAQQDLRVRPRQLRAERERVDGRGRTEDRRVGDVADARVLCQRPGQRAEKELGLIDPAVVRPDAGIRHIDRAVEKAHARILGRELAAGEDQRHRRGEDDLRAVGRGLFKRVLGTRIVRHEIDPRIDGLAERLHQLAPPGLMRGDPWAGLRRAFVDECRAQAPAEAGQTAKQALRLRRSLGLHGDLAALGDSLQLRPDGADGPLQLRLRQHAQIAQRVRVQPGQQRLRCRDGRRGLRQLVIGGLEGIKGREERAALELRPDVLGVEAERGLQLRIVAQAVEMHLIQAAALIKMQEFIVDPHSRVVGVQRQHARDVRADGRRAEAPQDAHALVALLHVKLPHILKAADGVDDAGVAQMRLAE